MLEVFQTDTKKEIALASLMCQIKAEDKVQNPNNVKVIVDEDNFALYFSRSPIPYYRNTTAEQIYHKHIGIYAFRRDALLEFSQSEMTPLEKAEKIECIRYLEQGKKMKMVLTAHESIGIDTPEDLLRAQEKINT